MKGVIRTNKGIKETTAWSSDSIREFCIKNDLYTAGDNTAYLKMLNYVESKKPTLPAQLRVAVDIWKHSDREVLDPETVLFMMNRDNAVMRFYNMNQTA